MKSQHTQIDLANRAINGQIIIELPGSEKEHQHILKNGAYSELSGFEKFSI